MGLIADLVKADPTGRRDFPRQGEGRRLWREMFGTSKEDSGLPPAPRPNPDGGTSLTGTNAAVKRLLMALRSSAPGGWSDDRWEQTRRYVGITYVAVHRQNEILTQAEFQVFRKDLSHPDGKIPIKEEDPPEGGRMVKPWDLVQLLEYPNPDDTFGDLISMMNLQMDLTGMSLTWEVPNQLGIPYELYPIPTATAIPQAVMNPDYPNGYYQVTPVYPYGPFSSYPTPNTTAGARVPAQWMLRVKYPHPLLRYDGYSPQTGLALHLDSLVGIDRSRFYKMKRSINPDAVLNFDAMEGAQPLPEPEIERIVAQFMNDWEGPENHGKVFVAAPGSKLEQWGTAPREMDYSNSWDQLSSFGLGGFGITKPAAGMVEDNAYATLFATLKQLYWLTLEPKCARIAGKFTRHIAPFFGDDLIVEVRCRKINDHEEKLAKLDMALKSKCVTKNEMRKELEFPLTTDQWGADIAGDPSPNEQQQMQQQQDNAFGMQKNELDADKSKEEQRLDHDIVKTEMNIEKTADRPRKLSEGSLGPQKSFSEKFILPKKLQQRTKGMNVDLFERINQELANGNGQH